MHELLDIKKPDIGQLVLVRNEDAVLLNNFTGQNWSVVKDFGYMDEDTFDAFMLLWPKLLHLFTTGKWIREKRPGQYAH